MRAEEALRRVSSSDRLLTFMPKTARMSSQWESRENSVLGTLGGMRRLSAFQPSSYDIFYSGTDRIVFYAGSGKGLRELPHGTETRKKNSVTNLL